MACVICKDQKVKHTVNPKTDERLYDCKVCGEYKITRTANVIVEGFPVEKRNKLSFKTRENYERGHILELDSDNIESIPESFVAELNIFETIDRLLLFVAKRQESPSEKANIIPTDAAVIYQTNLNDLNYYLTQCKNLGYLNSYGTNVDDTFWLTLEGWDRVLKIKEKEIKSNQAFVAMSFSKEKKEIWQQGIKPTLESLGYNAIRIDEKEHNDMIIDHIIAEIKKSGIIIADFTEHKHGVYFEAGYAMGLGIPVIWTCHEDDIKGIHFDTKPFNHIGWKTADELGRKLKIRIEATIPNRPKPRSDDSSL